MTQPLATPLFIGWDVGGWNCDKNPASRDALVVIDSERQLKGKPWRGNLRRCINQSDNTSEFIARLLELCELDPTGFIETPVVLAIDTPLGFSSAFIELVVQGRAVGPIENSSSNPYLFRHTERFLFERGLSPLSAVKDMIGSQATKGMHVLARFAPYIERCGVWTDNRHLRVIEAYPASGKRSTAMRELLQFYGRPPHLGHPDQWDALACALIAWAFHLQPELLAQPCAATPEREGWIFVPADGLGAQPEK